MYHRNRSVHIEQKFDTCDLLRPPRDQLRAPQRARPGGRGTRGGRGNGDDGTGSCWTCQVPLGKQLGIGWVQIDSLKFPGIIIYPRKMEVWGISPKKTDKQRISKCSKWCLHEFLFHVHSDDHPECFSGPHFLGDHQQKSWAGDSHFIPRN